jgi:hypothetical protein
MLCPSVGFRTGLPGEKQRLSDEWIKTVPKTDYAAIARAIAKFW